MQDFAPRFNAEAFGKMAADKATVGDLSAMESYERMALWTALCERQKNQNSKFDVRSFNMWLTLAVDFASLADLKVMEHANRTLLWRIFSQNLADREGDVNARLRFGNDRATVLVALIVEFGAAEHTTYLNEVEKSLLLKTLDEIRTRHVNAWDPVRHREMWLAANGGVASEQAYVRHSESLYTEKQRKG